MMEASATDKTLTPPKNVASANKEEFLM